MSSNPTDSIDQQQRIRCDIDQIIVQTIFRKLATSNKKRDDALWAITSEAAAEIRSLLNAEVPPIIQAARAEASKKMADDMWLWTHDTIRDISPENYMINTQASIDAVTGAYEHYVGKSPISNRNQE